ncbi:MAG: acetate--CoA ligase family protein [Candidatus Poribacteria bacterium]|nr:acetate--CoA ligase family protein [Candidatus Poribacteria bacterium]
MSNPLNDILNPKSVALIGASRNPTSFSYTYLSIMKNYGYRGNIYPINPRADSILDLKCYPSILDVPDEIDLAIVVTARQIAGASVEECVEKGVKGIVLLTGGFAEFDNDGRAAQDDFVRQAKEKGIRVIGPNTLGFFSAPAKFDGLLSGYIREGSIGLVGQSGNLTRSLAFPGIKRGLGFRYIIGLGNQADVQFHEVVRYLREDENVNAIGLHVEGVNDGRKFLDEVTETTKVKPVVVMKTGRTEQGARVISSHTASLAGQDEVFDAAFKQCGALRVESAVEFSSLLLALSHGKLPKGNRVGILSEGGGDCALTADACTLKGLDLPTFSPEHQERLREIVPEIGQVTNPVDMAMWEKIPEVAEIMLEGDEIDGLIVVGGFAGWDFLNPNVAPEVEASAEKMAALIAKTEKPLLIYTYYPYADSKSFETLRDNRVPLFMDHHDAVNTMAGLVRYTRYKATKAERRFSVLIGAKPAAGESRTKPLLEHQANRLLETAGTPFPAYRFAATRQEAIDAAEEIGYPVVLKIISQDVLHKSEVGCVKLGLHTPEAVACAFDEVIANARTFKRDARITGALLSKMEERGGVEVIIGGLNDSTFGPTLMFGLGGVYVEVMRDVSFRVCPITPDNADQMIRELDGFPLLAGIRGGKPVNLESLRAALLNVSAFLMENPRIAQLDLNPVKVHERGLSVLDARLIQYAD